MKNRQRLKSLNFLYRIFLLLAINFLLISNVNSQIVEIGTGTETNEITQSSPVNINNRRSVAYILYKADELIEGGAIGGGEINQLGFYVTNSPLYDIPNYEIQIKHTSSSNTSSISSGGFTTVKNIESYSPTSGGWDMLNLDTPFNWDGVQNIVIRICWSAVFPSSDASGQVRVFSSPANYRYYGGLLPFGDGCDLNPRFNQNFKPHVRFIFQEETIWTGTISSDWENATNWTAGVPNKDMIATIPSGTPNEPEIDGFAFCKTLNQNGSLTIGIGSELCVYEQFNNTGSVEDLGGELIFRGSSEHFLNSSNQLTLNNLHSDAESGFVINNHSVRVKNQLIISKGTIETADSLILNSDATKTARIDEIKSTCLFTIEMEDTYGDGWNGASLIIREEGEIVGEISCQDDASSNAFQIVEGRELTLEYTAGDYESENSYQVLNAVGEIVFSDGPSPDEGVVFTTVAEGCEIINGVNGDITMERYIDAGETYWRYFASAVENPKIEQYLDDFTTAGFEGSPFPDFPFNSIAWYDETRDPGDGYVSCESTEEVITVGKGYQVWSGDTITGTEPFLVDLVGRANQGDISIPVTYTFSDTPSEDGWNLIGNPYPSTINWDASAWTKTNMANAIYIQDPDTKLFAAYVAGAGVNGGTKYIASQQSFWVLAIDEAPELIIREGAKSNVDAIFYEPEELSPGMTIQIKGFEKEDQAVLRHVASASMEMEHEFDALDLFGGWGTQPQLSIVNEFNQDFAIQSFDKGNQEWSIPLRVIVFESGMYELTFNQLFELDVPCMQLEDTYTGEFYSIEEGAALSFEISDTTFAPRFMIHLGRDYHVNTNPTKCFGLNDGKVEIDFGIDSVSYQLSYDDITIENTVAASPMTIDSLASGWYTIEMVDFEDLCGQNDFTFNIEQPDKITLSASIEDENLGNDGVINVVVSGGTAPYAYEWCTGSTENVIVDLPSGGYVINITDYNGCSLDSTFNVNPNYLEITENENDRLTGFFDANSNRFVLENMNELRIESIHVYNLNGQLLSSTDVRNNNQKVSINLPSVLSNGMYFVQVLGDGPTKSLGTFKVVK